MNSSCQSLRARSATDACPMAIVPAKANADFGMLFFKCDGTLGEMCGNGARCICRYGYETGLAGETQTI